MFCYDLQMRNWSIVSLVAGNLVPLFGVLFFGWSVGTIIVIYWCENLVIGFYNVMKMIAAKGEKPTGPVKVNNRLVNSGGKIFMIVFFMVHYGMFTLVHGVFVFTLFGEDLSSFEGIFLAVVSLLVGNGVSFFKDYIATGEHRNKTVNDLFFQPYKRVVILHLTILTGGFAAMGLDAPQTALAVLVILKIGVDIWVYRRERS